MKNIVYSKFRYYDGDTQYRKLKKYKNPNLLINEITRVYIDEKTSSDERAQALRVLDSIIYSRNKYNCLFVEDIELIDNLNHIDAPVDYCFLDILYNNTTQYKLITGILYRSLIIHFPNERHSFRITEYIVGEERLFSFTYNTKADEYIGLFSTYKINLAQECIMRDLNEHIFSKTPTLYTINKLFFYMETFPELLKDGLPSNVVSLGKSKTIKNNEKFNNTNILMKNTISMHIRRAHFRVLRSDKFKGKRFKTIFVKASIINGTAKTLQGKEEE